MAPGRVTPRNAAEWGAVLPVWLGAVGLVFCAVFWAATGRVEPSLLLAFGGSVTVGQGAQALAALRSAQAPPDDSTRPSETPEP